MIRTDDPRYMLLSIKAIDHIAQDAIVMDIVIRREITLTFTLELDEVKYITAIRLKKYGRTIANLQFHQITF